MPGTAQGIKEELLRAIDESGNVLDMKLLVSVLNDLESVRITAEDLTVTRLGLYINNARRQTKDKTLARRMKDLLKEWKILVQNSQSNGVAPPSQLTTPSISPAPLSTTPALALSEEPSSESGLVTPKQNPQLSHRKLLLSKLSAFKKPQTTPTATPPTIEPINTSHSLPLAPPPPLHVSNGKPGSTNNSLTIRYPLDRLPKQQETRGPLIVSISLSLIKLSGRNEAPPTEGVPLLHPGLNERSSPLSFQSLSPVSYQETRPSPLPPPSLSLPLPPPPSLSLPPSPSSLTPPLIVSIPLSLLTSPTLVPAARKPLPTTMQQVHEEETSSSGYLTNSVSGKTLRSISPEQPTSRLKTSPPLALPPPDCLPGFDGTIGSDGNWYSWTDVIHYPKPMVTVLPYVYIDGFDPNEM
ncbi:PREDICTED: proline-rich protein 36-like isoform X1 [Amphimedon queenslandica]|uniref:Mediator of RNA polymerase II transcription subunit 26 n=1 Tax=Amphimedon queenslandica TaxID=400682 RepID=A0AAN0JHF6_AMPQE|nr:PREDICTED: proline-rich protein 36-like isoform X1 [Amphimedon queenslandica]|eukprot:XP_019856465.1 PREDICTED: proline-rich protein 36-like isoform X1 [Amphimedon queenslandica]